MNRITPEKIKEAYTETGLKPLQGAFLTSGCACGLGVMYAHKMKTYIPQTTHYGVSQLSPFYSYDYMVGFWHGFDGKKVNPSRSSGPKCLEVDAGYNDGVRCWQAAKEFIREDANE